MTLQKKFLHFSFEYHVSVEHDEKHSQQLLVPGEPEIWQHEYLSLIEIIVNDLVLNSYEQANVH